MMLQRLLKKAQCRRFVVFLSDVALQDLTLLINGTPQDEALHSVDRLLLDVSREHWPEVVPLKPHGFMAYAYPTLEQEIFDVPQ